jgi:hypothetical protein
MRIQSRLNEVKLRDLRPTQMTVGFAEVDKKRRSWAKLSAAHRRNAMREELFIAVLGPGSAYYILDHHHTALALIKEESEAVQVGIAKDLSTLKAKAFWIFMDHFSWAHPYDALGRRRKLEAIPPNFEALEDDPYRSLAGAVRDAGGFAKSEAPFLEFLWANHLRDLMPRSQLESNPGKALRAALAIARSKKSSHLPGWAGWAGSK